MSGFENLFVSYANQPTQHIVAVFDAPTPSYYLSVASVAASSRSESMNRIDAISKLRDGWDGYGAYAPRKDVCEYTKSLIGRLGREFPALGSPDIAPTSNGTVLLTWETENAEAVLEIGDAAFTGYIQRSGNFLPVKGAAASLGPSELSAIAGCLL